MKANPLIAADFYKMGHYKQYPTGTEQVYSNFTARSSRHSPVPEYMRKAFGDEVIFFGLQGTIKEYIIEMWNQGFFMRPQHEVLAEYKRLMDSCLGPGAVGIEHIAALWDLGYLPIEIMALPEGTKVPLRVPMFTIKNTLPQFYWVTNYLETALSAESWKPITATTISHYYRKLLDSYAEKTGSPKEFVPWQAHDFSMRGMSGIHDAAKCGAGHLLSFTGTDTIPAIAYLQEYYDAEGLIGGSVPASEHSVQTFDGVDGEFEYFERMITEVAPSGIVSIVSDGFDYFKVLTEYLPKLKDKIMAREGKCVIRPDSGNPADIICGTEDVYYGEGKTPEEKGSIELLWDLFGGTINEKGYKVLDPHIGLIYGDSITLERADEILTRLEYKGFASCNVVFGVGSFSMNLNSRDSYGIAIKATAGRKNGQAVEIFKDPKTDSGTKKSARGYLKVIRNQEGVLELVDQISEEQINDPDNVMRAVFRNGRLLEDENLEVIRNRLRNEAKS